MNTYYKRKRLSLLGGVGIPKGNVIVLIAAIGLSAIFGLFIAYEIYFLLALFICGLIGGLIIFNPNRLFVISLTVSLVFVGIIESFGNFPKGNWLGSIILGALLFSILTSRPILGLMARKSDPNMALIFGGLSIYILTIVFSSLINSIPIVQAAVGVRAYIPYMALLFTLLLGRISASTFDLSIKLLIFIGCIQGPFCIIEKLFVAPRIVSIFGDQEMMLGTFGGSFVSGGYTGEMATFTCMNLVLCFVLAQEKIIKNWVVWLASISAVSAVGLGETKIVFVVFPVMMGLVFYQYPGVLSLKMLRGLAWVACGLAIVTAIYSNRFWDGGESNEVGHAFFYTFDPNFMVTPTQRGRVASIFYWAQQIGASGSYVNGLIGYGIGSSTSGPEGTGSGVAGLGSAVKLFGLGLDSSALTKLLWETGLIGVFSLMAMLLGAFRLAVNASKNEDIPPFYRWCLVALKTWLATFVIMLPYQQSILGGTAVQFLFWFTIGAIVYVSKWKIPQK